MPVTTFKTKAGNSYTVKYRVVGDVSSLTREQLEVLAIRQLRNSARNYCVGELNAAEPGVLVTNNLIAALRSTGAQEDQISAFLNNLKATGQPVYTSVPSEFQIPITELLPSESGRGREAANIFEFGGEEEEVE